MVRARSAREAALTVAVSVWSPPGLLKGVVLETVAVLTTLPTALWLRVPMTRMVALPPAGNVPKAHGKPVHPPWLLLTMGFTISTGRLSVTVTNWAALGPVLVTTI